MKGLFPVLSTNISKSKPAGGLGLDTGQDATMGEGSHTRGWCRIIYCWVTSSTVTHHPPRARHSESDGEELKSKASALADLRSGSSGCLGDKSSEQREQQVQGLEMDLVRLKGTR